MQIPDDTNRKLSPQVAAFLARIGALLLTTVVVAAGIVTDPILALGCVVAFLLILSHYLGDYIDWGRR